MCKSILMNQTAAVYINFSAVIYICVFFKFGFQWINLIANRCDVPMHIMSILEFSIGF